MHQLVSLLCFLPFLAYSLNAFGGEPSEKGKSKTFIIATWNLGHFSNGVKQHSAIDSASYKDKCVVFQRVLNDSINADVICFNEYSKVFGKDEKHQKKNTRALFLNNYKYAEIGVQRGYCCNSIFSRYEVTNVKLCEYEICQTVSSLLKRAANYYYLESDLIMDGVKIKLICSHNTARAYAISQAQIAELLNKYRDEERVIMCGDWNTTDFSLFKHSGYTATNDGSLKTFPSKGLSLDNILVKGLKVIDARIIRTDFSDHYPLLCNILIE